MSLDEYGWNDAFASSFEPFAGRGLAAGRVVFAGRGLRVAAAGGEIAAAVSGALRNRAAGPRDLPAVGDWVAFRPAGGDGPAAVEAVLPRRTALIRKVAGRRAEEQVVAANLDTVFVVMGLDGDYNPRRLERYLALIWESGARPAAVLNKEDLLPPEEAAACQEEIEEVALGVPVYRVSCLTGAGLDRLRGELSGGLEAVTTVALVGSSGAGKSTLLNRLAGREVMATGAVRAGDDRGTHTTTHRQIVRLPGGALLIDNPGLREIGLWGEGDGLARAFDDVGELAESCHFRDCRHQGEPGCAVEEAVEEGRLEPERLESLRRLEKELSYLERRRDEGARRLEKAKWKAIHKEIRRFYDRERR